VVYVYSCLYCCRSVSMSDSVEENERTSPLLRCALVIVSLCELLAFRLVVVDLSIRLKPWAVG